MSKPRTSARARASTRSTPAPAQDGNGAQAQTGGVRVIGHSLAIGSRRVAMSSGALHYFRLKPNAWRPALEAMQALGLQMVETYVPWGVHEISAGNLDFGSHDPSKDLGAFLDLVHSLGMLAIVRPGPNINAELTYFGLPARIIFDEACQARSPRGHAVPFIAPPRMFPVPSYASEHFLAETADWFAEVAKVLRPRIAPDGPVVMLQVDNEAAFYFRDGPFDQDYHPDAIAKYRRFLQQRHGSIDALNRRYEIQFADWEVVDPPQRFEGDSLAALRRQLEWMEFHEELIVSALLRMHASLRAHGLGELPSLHNLPLGEGGLPAQLARIDADLDVVGLDYYHRRHELGVVRERTLRLVGSASVAYAPEMGVGAPPWFAPRSDDDSLHTLLCACAYGVRGMNLYMAVDRDRWYGAPIDEDGHARPSAEPLTRVLGALARTGFHELTRKVEVAIVLPKPYARLSRATHMLGALSPTLLDLSGVGASAASLRDPLGFAAPIQVEWPVLVKRFAGALAQAGVPYVYIESDADIARYEGIRLVITPSYELTDAEHWQRLHELSERGVHILYGPMLPSLDGALERTEFLEPKNATLFDAYEQTDAEQLVQEEIAKLELARPFPCSPATVDAVAHEDESGTRVLFLVHPHDGLCAAEVKLPGPMILVDVLSDERFEGDASLTIPLTAHSVRMFVCETARPSATRSKAPSARRGTP